MNRKNVNKLPKGKLKVRNAQNKLSNNLKNPSFFSRLLFNSYFQIVSKMQNFKTKPFLIKCEFNE